MRDELREKLNTEITRKQFLQYLTAALLMVFGIDNLISLLTGGRIGSSLGPRIVVQDASAFGTRKFGV